jgi:hypothetical protein
MLFSLLPMRRYQDVSAMQFIILPKDPYHPQGRKDLILGWREATARDPSFVEPI